MPEVYVHAAKGRTAEQKRGLLIDITEAVVKNLGATRDSVTVTIIESDLDLKAKGGVPFNER
jgi:4-oxalocrotonate tautomerase